MKLETKPDSGRSQAKKEIEYEDATIEIPQIKHKKTQLKLIY
jgi:hypothetical protein